MINQIVLLILLFAASYTDLKTKEIPHTIFIIGLALAFILSLNNLISFVLYLTTSIVLMYLLWKTKDFGGGFGGGDAKMFILVFVFLQSITSLIVFVLSGILFVGYTVFVNSKEKRFVPFIFTALLIKIIVFILLNG